MNEKQQNPILTTKLFSPKLRPGLVPRPQLLEKLDQGLNGRLTLISAPAGFGKTTLVCEWISSCDKPVAWLSLDERDNDPSRFLIYTIAALQTIEKNIGKDLQIKLQSLQQPPIESILTMLINEITTISDDFVFVVDDYHVVDTQTVDKALAFLIDKMPQQMHFIIVTREDPTLPLARLRARGSLIELRAEGLRFNTSEATKFLNQVMNLHLSEEDITALENRTEGWIAGLQLAAISMQGQKDVAEFIKSFTGSHHFVMDYLVEEVLQQQSESIQNFLISTSILDRMCAPLCAAILNVSESSGQKILKHLENANLFLVPLDNERRWYRYHHLFAELLQQRLHRELATPNGDENNKISELHKRASIWFGTNGLGIEALQHAIDANDVDRIIYLVERGGLPFHSRAVVTSLLNWLDTLPKTMLNTKPSLWVLHARALLTIGLTKDVEGKLQAAEVAIQGVESDAKIRDLIGQIAANRATLALSQHQAENIILYSKRALEFLSANNLDYRAGSNWKLGYAYYLNGNRAAATQAYSDAISNSQPSNIFIKLLAYDGLGQVQETENQLHQAVKSYNKVLKLFNDQPLPIACESHLGLARIFYEWNDLDAAQQHGQQGLQLARQYESNIDRYVSCEVFLARVKLARGDVAGATAILTKAEQEVSDHKFIHRIPEVVSAQVLTLLHQGKLTKTDDLVEKHNLPLSQARVLLAKEDPSTALTVLQQFRNQVEQKGWKDEQLKALVLLSLAHQALEEKEQAIQLLQDSLALAEPSGFIRTFISEGAQMKQLLSEALAKEIAPVYVTKLLTVFKSEKQMREGKSFVPQTSPDQPFIESLSKREIEVLQLIAQGFSNQEISKKLFIALPTVKGHNQKIFAKLNVQRRTEAIARARDLGLI